MTASHKSDGHVHETHGHKTTTSSEHGEKRKEDDETERITEKTGIFFVRSSGNVLVDLYTVVYFSCSKYEVDKIFIIELNLTAHSENWGRNNWKQQKYI